MSTQNNTIIIDDGTREYTIKNKFGKEICKVYIRPGDLSIMDRYKEVMKRIPDVIAPLRELSVKADGSADDDAEWDAIKKVQVQLEDELNYLFGMDEAQEIFKDRNPFSSVQGKFFCELIIEAIGNIIAQVINEEAEQIQERTKAYTDDLDTDTAEVTEDAGEPAEKS